MEWWTISLVHHVDLIICRKLGKFFLFEKFKSQNMHIPSNSHAMNFREEVHNISPPRSPTIKTKLLFPSIDFPRSLSFDLFSLPLTWLVLLPKSPRFLLDPHAFINHYIYDLPNHYILIHNSHSSQFNLIKIVLLRGR